MNKSMILSIVRHVLTTAGGFLVGAGYLDESTAQQAAGAIMTLIGAVWGVLEKRT
jgi:hypothetical protein